MLHLVRHLPLNRFGNRPVPVVEKIPDLTSAGSCDITSDEVDARPFLDEFDPDSPLTLYARIKQALAQGDRFSADQAKALCLRLEKERTQRFGSPKIDELNQKVIAEIAGELLLQVETQCGSPGFTVALRDRLCDLVEINQVMTRWAGEPAQDFYRVVDEISTRLNHATPAQIEPSWVELLLDRINFEFGRLQVDPSPAASSVAQLTALAEVLLDKVATLPVLRHASARLYVDLKYSVAFVVAEFLYPARSGWERLNERWAFEQQYALDMRASFAAAEQLFRRLIEAIPNTAAQSVQRAQWQDLSERLDNLGATGDLGWTERVAKLRAEIAAAMVCASLELDAAELLALPIWANPPQDSLTARVHASLPTLDAQGCRTFSQVIQRQFLHEQRHWGRPGCAERWHRLLALEEELILQASQVAWPDGPALAQRHRNRMQLSIDDVNNPDIPVFDGGGDTEQPNPFCLYERISRVLARPVAEMADDPLLVALGRRLMTELDLVLGEILLADDVEDFRGQHCRQQLADLNALLQRLHDTAELREQNGAPILGWQALWERDIFQRLLAEYSADRQADAGDESAFTQFSPEHRKWRSERSRQRGHHRLQQWLQIYQGHGVTAAMACLSRAKHREDQLRQELERRFGGHPSR